MKKNILLGLALLVVAIFIVSCAPGEAIAGQAVAQSKDKSSACSDLKNCGFVTQADLNALEDKLNSNAEIKVEKSCFMEGNNVKHEANWFLGSKVLSTETSSCGSTYSGFEVTAEDLCDDEKGCCEISSTGLKCLDDYNFVNRTSNTCSNKIISKEGTCLGGPTPKACGETGCFENCVIGEEYYLCTTWSQKYNLYGCDINSYSGKLSYKYTAETFDTCPEGADCYNPNGICA